MRVASRAKESYIHHSRVALVIHHSAVVVPLFASDSSVILAAEGTAFFTEGVSLPVPGVAAASWRTRGGVHPSAGAAEGVKWEWLGAERRKQHLGIGSREVVSVPPHISSPVGTLRCSAGGRCFAEAIP